MKAEMIASAVLAMVGGSTVAAYDCTAEQPIVVNATQLWTAAPATTAYRPMMIGSPAQYRRVPNATSIYTPLRPPAYVPITNYRPLLPIAPVPSQYRFGRGILGQPKVYVPGQPVRNLLRYLSP